MKLELKTLSWGKLPACKTTALLVLVADGFKPGADALSSLVEKAMGGNDFKTEPGSILRCYGAAGLTAAHVVLVGVGGGDAAATQSAVEAAVATLRSGSVRELTLFVPEQADLHAAVLAAAHAAYQYQETLTGHDKPLSPGIEHVTVASPGAGKQKAVFQQALAVAHGVNFAREWANRPANHATPSLLAKAAEELTSKQSGMGCKVLGPREITRLGMGGLQAVASGSAEEARFIELRYDGASKSDAPVVLVGKGITFDAGGISIKPAAAMDEMKFDMCGAASVLGVFRALQELRPAINVIGLIASCENLLGAAAVKPGDVITSMSGQTIEVLNTDAEGRLVLSDALTYAQRFKPAVVIDIATLTGACVVALGAVRSGLFANDEALAVALLQAGEQVYDRCWRMPLDDAYAKGLRSNFADVANVAGRKAGAVTAAKFLQRFIGEHPWAHLDIAGTAWKDGDAKGATGRPVSLLTRYLMNLAQDTSGKKRKTGV